MNELIPVRNREISGATAQTVNARDLWEFVGSKQDFSTWIKSRIEKYGFIDGEDYLLHRFMEQVPHQGGMRNAIVIDYLLTITTAKELAMVENNDKGRQVRRYFIECETQAKIKAAANPQQVLNDPVAMRGLLLTYTEKVLALEDKVLSLEPKSQALDRISSAFGAMNPTAAAKVLQIQPKRLFDWLRENHWIYRRAGGRGNVAYQNKIQAGYMTHKITTVQCDDGDKVIEQVLITAKGLAKLAMIFGVNLSAVHNDDSFSA